jgi:integrase
VTDLDDVAVFSVVLERNYVSPAALGNRWRRAAKAAGSTMRFHDLRHLNATEQLAGGVDVPAAAARNGWSSAKMLLDTYAHARRGADEASTRVLADVNRRIGEARAS